MEELIKAAALHMTLAQTTGRYIYT